MPSVLRFPIVTLPNLDDMWVDQTVPRIVHRDQNGTSIDIRPEEIDEGVSLDRHAAVQSGLARRVMAGTEIEVSSPTPLDCAAGEGVLVRYEMAVQRKEDEGSIRLATLQAFLRTGRHGVVITLTTESGFLPTVQQAFLDLVKAAELSPV